MGASAGVASAAGSVVSLQATILDGDETSNSGTNVSLTGSAAGASSATGAAGSTVASGAAGTSSVLGASSAGAAGSAAGACCYGEKHSYASERIVTSGSTSFFFSFLGLLGAFTFFSASDLVCLKVARSFWMRPGLLGLSSFLGVSATGSALASSLGASSLGASSVYS